MFPPTVAGKETSPERMNEQVAGACFSVCIKSGEASNICSQRQKEKDRKPPG